MHWATFMLLNRNYLWSLSFFQSFSLFNFFYSLFSLNFLTLFSIHIQIQYENSLFRLYNSYKCNKNFLCFHYSLEDLSEEWLLIVLFYFKRMFSSQVGSLWIFKSCRHIFIRGFLLPKSSEVMGPLSISFYWKISIITLPCRCRKTLRATVFWQISRLLLEK